MNLLPSVFNRFWRDQASKGLLPDLSPRGDAEAVELLGAGFPVPYGDEEGRCVANEVVWALAKVRAISEHNWVFRGWLVDNST